MNRTGNITINDFDIYSEGVKVTAAIVCILVFILGVVGNGLVLYVFGSRISRLKSFEIYLISLGAADLLASVTIPSKTFYDLVGGGYEYGGVSGCIIIHSLCTGSITVSCVTLIVISLNRYIVVKWPLHEHRSNFTLMCVIVGTWLVGVVLVIGLYAVKGRATLVDNGEAIICSMKFASPTEFRTYGATLFIIQSGAPLLSMGVLYGLIIYELKKTARMTLFQGRDHMINTIYQRNRKSIRLLIALLLVFFICTTPEKLLYVIFTFERENLDPYKFNLAYILLTLLLMLNHCINPIVYAKLHTSFRRHTLNIFCQCHVFHSNALRDSYHSVRNNNQTLLTANYSVVDYHGSHKRDSTASEATIQERRSPSRAGSFVGSIQNQMDTLLEHDGNNLEETNV